jgi:hypothetical protein
MEPSHPLPSRERVIFSDFANLNLGFVSDFEIRISDLLTSGGLRHDTEG